MSAGEKTTRESIKDFGVKGAREYIASLKDSITLIEDETHFPPIQKMYDGLVRILNKTVTHGRTGLPSDIIEGFNEINEMFATLNEDNEEEIFKITPLSEITTSTRESEEHKAEEVAPSVGAGYGLLPSHEDAVAELEAGASEGGLAGMVSGWFGGGSS
ncbi:MAG: hypothetical protein RLN62_02735 [Rickettsiales bacterium]